MMSPYQLLPALFLRTPLLSFAGYRDTTAEQLLASPHFRVALYLASPAFYRVLQGKGFDAALLSARELLSIKKYHNRMSFRPTPFGLFSAFTLTHWGEDGPILLPEAGGTDLHLLADMQVSMGLAQLLAPPLAEERFMLNPTLYLLGKEFRFIHTRSEPGHTRLSFSLQSLDASPLTKALRGFLKAGPASGAQIIAFLSARTGCTPDDAFSYLEFFEAGTGDLQPGGYEYLRSRPFAPSAGLAFTPAPGGILPRFIKGQRRYTNRGAGKMGGAGGGGF